MGVFPCAKCGEPWLSFDAGVSHVCNALKVQQLELQVGELQNAMHEIINVHRTDYITCLPCLQRRQIAEVALGGKLIPASKPMVVPSADESVGVADPTTGNPEPGQGASPAKIDPMASVMKCSPSQALENLAHAIGTMDAEERSRLCAEILRLEKELEQSNRLVGELQKLLCQCPKCFYGQRCGDAEAAYSSLSKRPKDEAAKVVESFRRGDKAEQEETLKAIEKRNDEGGFPTPPCDHEFVNQPLRGGWFCLHCNCQR